MKKVLFLLALAVVSCSTPEMPKDSNSQVTNPQPTQNHNYPCGIVSSVVLNLSGATSIVYIEFKNGSLKTSTVKFNNYGSQKYTVGQTVCDYTSLSEN